MEYIFATNYSLIMKFEHPSSKKVDHLLNEERMNLSRSYTFVLYVNREKAVTIIRVCYTEAH